MYMCNKVGLPGQPSCPFLLFFKIKKRQYNVVIKIGCFFFAEDNTITCATAALTVGSLKGTLCFREQVIKSILMFAM